MPWRIEMLGGLAVVQGDKRISRFQTQKTGALLAYLALHPSKAHSRESLAEMLWPEGDPTAIRNRLNQAISSLRRQLHPPELGPGTVLSTDHHTVAINAQVVISDVEEFERDLRQAERAEDTSERIRHLESAVSKYRGELLEGYYEEWVFSKRMHLADQFDQALQQLIRSLVEVKMPEKAVEYARRRLLIDPYDEGAHVILMRLYLRSGRPKSALKQFEDLERALNTFEDSPSEYALKYRARAEAVVNNQIEAEEEEEDDLPILSAKRSAEPAPLTGKEEVVPALPRVVSSFVGRDSELAQIADSFQSGRTRLLTVLGMGGCGKTRLSIEAGWQLDEAFGGRVFFVSLASVEEATDIPAEIARVVVPDQSSLDDPMLGVIERLRAFPKALLILDNFEQVTEEGAPYVCSLLKGSPNLCCLVTARIPLNLEGEVQLPLSPLPLPQAEEIESLQDLAANPSLALFVERAQAVKADFQLTERTAEAIVELCRRLEGLPLALELAASWARVMTPSQMLDQIRTNVDQLASRRKDISSRHRSLRAVFDGSYALLDENLRYVFLRLTFFSGGWDYESAQHLCSEADVFEAIHSLEERSMIFSEPTDHSVRFGMLETVRSFGENLVTPDQFAECGWHHAEYFLVLAEKNLPFGPWAVTIEADYTNCLAALRWLEENDRSEEFARLAIALSRYWEGRGLLVEGREWMNKVLTKHTLIDPLLVGRAKTASGHLDWVSGDFELAERGMREALELFRTYDSKQDQLEAQYVLQLEAHRKGAYEESQQLLNANLLLAEELGDDSASARCLLALGNGAIEQEDWKSAGEFYERSLESGRKNGDQERISAALTNLANLAIYQNHLEAARKWLDEAWAQILPAQYRWRSAMSLIVQGRLENVAGNYGEACRKLVTAYQTAPDEKLAVWRFLMQFGFTLSGLGLTNDAIRTFGFLEKYREKIGETHRGIEMRTYEVGLEKLRASVDPDRYAEQVHIGRTMSMADLDLLILKATRIAEAF